MSKYLTDFNPVNSPALGDAMTIKDMLSHCSGLSPLPYEVIGKNGSIFARREDVIDICNHLPRQTDFRSEWKYNNWMFALASPIITQQSDRSFGDFVRQEVFDPLNMKRTFCFNPDGDDNYAKPYLVYGNGKFEAVPFPTLVSGLVFDSSGSIRSCVRDILTWTKALMVAWKVSRSDSSNKDRSGLHSGLISWFEACLGPQFSFRWRI